MASPLIATGGGGAAVGNTEVANAPFFAELITLAAYRAQSRIDRTAADDQALRVLGQAVVTVNIELAEFVNERLIDGIVKLVDVPVSGVFPPTFYVDRYRYAVFAEADALLAEAYRDFDSTADGDKRADAMAERIENYRRERIYAVRDLLGQPRVRVSLL